MAGTTREHDGLVVFTASGPWRELGVGSQDRALVGLHHSGAFVRNAEPLPRWLMLPLKVALCLFISYGVSGVALAIVGWFRPAPVLAVAAVLTAGMLRVSRPWGVPSSGAS